MKNKFMVLLCGIIFFVGCGSTTNTQNNDFDKEDDKKETPEDIKKDTVKTAKGVYVDSAINGVTYVCGSKTGITGDSGKDGSFTFEVGKDCLFKINNTNLTKIVAAGLREGVEVRPNLETARYLQSLDDDGNASNGINILPSVVKALKDKGIVGLQQTDDQVNNMINKLNGVSGYDGIFISMAKAAEHLIGFSVNVTTDKNSYQYGDDVTLTANITGNSDGLQYTWKEGDTVLGNDQQLIVRNFNVGTHTVNLIVTNQDSISISSKVDIVISDIANNPPVANAGADITVKNGEQLHFDGSLSTDDDGTIIKYEWIYDSKVLNSDTTIPTFTQTAKLGNYTVTLRVTDNNGATAEDTVLVQVVENSSSDFNITSLTANNDEVIIQISENLMWVNESDVSKGKCAKIHSDTFATEFNSAKTFCSSIDGFAGKTGWRTPTASELQTFITSTIDENILPAYDAQCAKLLALTNAGADIDDNNSYVTVTTRYDSSGAGTVSNPGELIPSIGLRCVRDNN